jgi:hypothetical protein
MSETETPPSARFNRAATLNPHAAELHAHVDKLIAEKNEQFKEEAPARVQACYQELLKKQGMVPELRPGFAQENPTERLMKAAQMMVKFEHLREVNTLRRTSQMMITHGLEH